MFKKFISMLLVSSVIASSALSGVATLLTNPVEVSASTIDYNKGSFCYMRLSSSELIPASSVEGYKVQSFGSWDYVWEVMDISDDGSDELSYYVDFREDGEDGKSYGWYKLDMNIRHSYIAYDLGNGNYRVAIINMQGKDFDEQTWTKEKWKKVIEDEKKRDKEIEDDFKYTANLGVRKHISKKSVTLSSAENAGTLVVNSVDAKTLSKLDKMLNSEKKLTLKIKAKKESEAKSKLNKLKSDIGHMNEWGITFYLNREKDMWAGAMPMFYRDKVSLKKSGGYYVATVTKAESLAYKYSVEGINNVYNSSSLTHYRKSHGCTELKKGVHPCDCSDMFKLGLIAGFEKTTFAKGEKQASTVDNWYKYCGNLQMDGWGWNCNSYMFTTLNAGAMFGVKPYINRVKDCGNGSGHVMVGYYTKGSNKRSAFINFTNTDCLMYNKGYGTFLPGAKKMTDGEEVKNYLPNSILKKLPKWQTSADIIDFCFGIEYFQGGYSDYRDIK